MNPKLQVQLDAIEAKAKLQLEKEKQLAIAAFESVEAKANIIKKYNDERAVLIKKHLEEHNEIDANYKEEIRTFEKEYGVSFANSNKTKTSTKSKPRKYTKATKAEKVELAILAGYVYNSTTKTISNTKTGNESKFDGVKKANIIFTNPNVKGEKIALDKTTFVNAACANQSQA